MFVCICQVDTNGQFRLFLELRDKYISFFHQRLGVNFKRDLDANLRRARNMWDIIEACEPVKLPRILRHKDHVNKCNIIVYELLGNTDMKNCVIS